MTQRRGRERSTWREHRFETLAVARSNRTPMDELGVVTLAVGRGPGVGLGVDAHEVVHPRAQPGVERGPRRALLPGDGVS